MSRRSRVRQLVEGGIFAGLVVAGILVWSNRTALADDFRLWNYTPSSNVAALAGNIGFTGEGQRYFYASHPAIDDKQAFNQACGDTEAHTTVLGCYVNYSIFIYNVTDERLTGVQEVTAAHETLHAAYARLTDGQRADVDAMLSRQYDAMVSNAGFKSRFAVYDNLSEADKLNELHSIFGTEVTPLSGELEAYYGRYFKDRSVLTNDYKAYQGQFTALKDQQEALKTQIDTLKNEITATESAYQSDRAALDTDIQAFNGKANGGGYTNQRDFNNDRAALVSRSGALNVMAEDINAKIDAYNNAIKQYNALTIQTQDLQNSLDSKSVQSAPTL